MTPHPWKLGDEFLPFHPDASHVSAEFRDGWNRCYAMAVGLPSRVGAEGWKRLAESQQAFIESERRVKEISERYGLSDGVPGWVLVPRIGTRVRAEHPQTCLNPEPTFEVVEVKADTTGSGFAVRGENTCWFGVGMVLPDGERGAVSPSCAATDQQEMKHG